MRNAVEHAGGKSVCIGAGCMLLAGVGRTLGGKVPGFTMGADQYRSLQFDNTTDDNDIGAFGVSNGDLTGLDTYLGV